MLYIHQIYSPLITGVVLCFSLVARSQQDFSKHIAVNTHYGFIFAHTKDVENTAGSRPFGFSVELSKLKFDSASYNVAKCYPRSGISLVYFNYDNKVLGHSLTAAYFIEPSFLLSPQCMFAPRASVGLSYLTNPYHPVRNPGNNSYSLPLSVFLQVGLSFQYKITPKADFLAAANYLHVSNGGLNNPNKGINWPTASMGFSYRMNDAEFKKQKYHPAKRFSNYHRIEAGVYSSLKTIEENKGRVYPIPGFYVSYHRRINNLHSIGIIADIHQDHSLAARQKQINETPYFNFPSFAIGHEYLLGRFSFWQQVGYYVIVPDERFNRWYHRWGLNYSLTNRFSVGTSIKAHAQVAHFADLRLGYRFSY
jgi:hypothetical protein